jgi:hypothetical protein
MIVGILLTLLCYYANEVSIEEYGAIPNVYTLEAAEQNARAFSKTFNTTNSSSDHAVDVPAGFFNLLYVNVFDI